MSKTVYLLTIDGTCVAFGAGMAIYDGPLSVRVANTNGGSLWNAILATASHPRAVVAKWARAIAFAPDGALLRWDEDKKEVTMEPEADSHFVDTPLLTTLPIGGMDADDTFGNPFFCPVCDTEIVYDHHNGVYVCPSGDAHQAIQKAVQ